MPTIITVYDETLDDTKNLEIFDPERHLEDKGRSITSPPGSCRCRCSWGASGCIRQPQPGRRFRPTVRQQVDTLWDEVKRFDNPHSYYVDLSQKLWNIQQDLLRNRK